MKQSIKVPLADIKQFKKNSSFIKSYGILPILDYIKFDNGEIVKTNLREYVVQLSDFVGSFLVEERILFNFIEYSKASDLIFTIDKKKISITDGNTTVTSQTDDIELFPKNQQAIGAEVQIPADVLHAISTASKYTVEEEYNQIKPFVFVGNQSIFASDGLIGFFKKLEFDVPKMVLTARTSDKIGSLPSVEFSENEKFHFFRYMNITYVFVKPEATYKDLSQYFNFEKDISFSIQKDDLLTFNDTCIAISPSKAIYPGFEMYEGCLSLSMVDADYNLDVKKCIPANGTMNGRFEYIGTLMSKLLKTAPDEKLTFYQGPAKFYITGESGFTSLIMKLVKQ